MFKDCLEVLVPENVSAAGQVEFVQSCTCAFCSLSPFLSLPCGFLMLRGFSSVFLRSVSCCCPFQPPSRVVLQPEQAQVSLAEQKRGHDGLVLEPKSRDFPVGGGSRVTCSFSVRERPRYLC